VTIYISLHKGLGVYGFSVGDVLTNGLRCFFTPFGRLVHLRPDAGLVWVRHRTYPRALLTPNGSVGCAIPDNCGANQLGRNGVSGNDNHSLLITSKESQFAIQFFHYRLPLCPVQLSVVSWVNIVAKSNKLPFPMILIWDRKWVNVVLCGRPFDWLMSWTSYSFCLWETNGRTSERASEVDPTTLFHSICGVRRSSLASGARRTGRPMEWKSAFRSTGL